MANVLYNMRIHIKLQLNTIIQHSISVKKGVKKSLLVVDMPKGSYKNPYQAKKKCKIILKRQNVMQLKLRVIIKILKLLKKLKKLKYQ